MKRKSPKQHRVITKHPRYRVTRYQRGQKNEYHGSEIESYNDPKVFNPKQGMRDFKVGDKVAIWEPNDRGIALSKGWTIHALYGRGGDGVFLLKNPNYAGGEPIKHWGGDAFAGRLVLEKERTEPKGTIVLGGKTYEKAEARRKLEAELISTYGFQSGVQLVRYKFIPKDGVVYEIVKMPTPPQPQGNKKMGWVWSTRIVDLKTKEVYADTPRKKMEAYSWYNQW